MLCTELYALVVFVKSPHSLVPRSFGLLTQTTRAYNPVRRTFYDVNYIYDSQCGFREKRSTEHALLDMINQIESNMGAELYSCGIFIDLRKTFDTVDHQILLSKLHHY